MKWNWRRARPLLLAMWGWIVVLRGGEALDWGEYLGGADRNHCSPLSQINRQNVNRLRVAWEYHSGDFGQNQCNPITVNGVLFGATASSHMVALDAASGREIWTYFDPTNLKTFNNDRGVTYWRDGTDERILCTIGP